MKEINFEKFKSRKIRELVRKIKELETMKSSLEKINKENQINISNQSTEINSLKDLVEKLTKNNDMMLEESQKDRIIITIQNNEIVFVTNAKAKDMRVVRLLNVNKKLKSKTYALEMIK